jgi:hypothetical protein
MKGKFTQPNRFKEYHEYLMKNKNEQFKSSIEEICRVLGCNSASYYRKLSYPHLLSISDKKAIAEVYELPTHFIFPELELHASN